MNAQRTFTMRPGAALLTRALCGLALLSSAGAYAEQMTMTTQAAPTQFDLTPMTGADATPPAPSHGAMPEAKTPAKSGGMNMGSMQGGSAPPNARDPNAFADGYDYGSMPGMEAADQIRVNKLLVDELEWVHSRNGDGVSWKIRNFYGGDQQKLLLRTDGSVVNRTAAFNTGAEALWWRALSPFWGTVLGVRQELGRGAHTQAAFGVEGIAPYWFEVEATGYVAEDGRLSARLLGTYDLLLTNRWILTPEVETNLYSRADPRRGVGSGLANVSAGVRLRYEFSRTFAPYIGVNWERRFKGTGGPDEGPTETQVLVGVRMLW
jgi:copper resistance protein B